MKELPQVRVVRGFMDGCHAYNVGDLVRPSGVTRDIWRMRGLAKLVTDDVATEDNTARPQTATVQVRRKRGRPRKVRESVL